MESWSHLLPSEEELKKVYSDKTPTYPPDPYTIFKAMKPEEIKVVILGQDPYHGTGQANGRAFAVNPDIKMPPSLKNIYREIMDEGFEVEIDKTLLSWEKQGVFLLNSALTVYHKRPNSHSGFWKPYTDKIIEFIAEQPQKKVFMLWGANSIKKSGFITGDQNLILESAHPSPLSAHRGFFGNGHFKKANEFLDESIKW
jgi:uracil-DNA glycosylase